MIVERWLVTLLLVIWAAAPIGALEISVKDHGAKGDGRADDGPAIRAAINVVRKAGGGTITFPEGIYRVTAPKKEAWKAQFSLCSGITLRGVGMERSVIRVADNQGPYDVIFEGVDLEDIALMDLGFDANGASNPVVTESDSVSSPYIHTLLHLNGSKGVQIHRCKFTNVSGVWAIFASEGMERVVIDSCLFDRVGGFTANDWDHSTIYVGGEDIVVTDNILRSRMGAGTTGARTAIELHGSKIHCAGNRISGFRYGINVCSGGESRPSGPSVHQTYFDNHMTDVGCGFAIWGLADRHFVDLSFERNDITINVEGWREVFPEFYGIGLVAYSDTPPPALMQHVSITDNRIAFLGAEAGEERSCGIRLDFAKFDDGWSEEPAGTIDDLRIERNRIVGAASTGIDLNAIGSVVSLAENTVIDPGVGVEADLSRCGIRLRGKLKGVKVVGNAIYTHRDPPIVCGIRIETDDSDQFVFERNRISGGNSDGIPLLFPKMEQPISPPNP